MAVLRVNKVRETRHRHGKSEGKSASGVGLGGHPMSMTLSLEVEPACCMNAEHASRENGTEEHHPD